MTPVNPSIDSGDALSDLVRQCSAEALPLVDYGIDHDGVGHPPPVRHLRFSQTGDVLEHYQRDMTVRAAAGITLGRLQEVLRLEQQFFPVDVDSDLTLGEVINHNIYGPLRVGYGAVRDLILGLRYVDGEGRQIHVGGRTVKNVAGYDLSRFMVGSLGEMGVVYEATLRTYALPQAVALCSFTLEDLSALDSRMTDWLKTDAAPTWLAATLQGGRATIHTGYFGSRTACDVQRGAVGSLAGDLDGATMASTEIVDYDRDLAWRTQWRQWRRKAQWLCKIMVAPASTGAACERLRNWANAADGRQINALPTHGCIFVGSVAGEDGGLDAFVETVVTDLDALRQWHRRPAHAEPVPPFAPPQSDWWMLEKLKATMDPCGLFNPGRLIASPEETP